MKKFRLLFLFLSIFLIGCSKNLPNSSSKDLKIAVLSPSAAEILCEIGAEDLIVCKTSYCDYPSSLEKIPTVGDWTESSISLEAILQSGCNFVYGSKGIHDNLAKSLKNFGITVYLSNPTSINELINEISYISKITNHQNEGEKLISSINNKLISINKTSNFNVYYEIWNVPYMSVGKKSFINDVIQANGSKNIFGKVNQSYPYVSEESIILANPDIILIPNENGITVEMIKERAGWSQINAVKNDKIYLVNTSVFSRPGPRILEAISLMETYCE